MALSSPVCKQAADTRIASTHTRARGHAQLQREARAARISEEGSGSMWRPPIVLGSKGGAIVCSRAGQLLLVLHAASCKLQRAATQGVGW